MAAAVHRRSDVGDGTALQVLHFYRHPLVLRQPGQGAGEGQQFLVAAGPLTRRRLIGGQRVRQTGRRLAQLGLDGALPAHVARPGGEPARGVGQVVGQHLAQECRPRRIVQRQQPAGRLVCFQQRLLDHVRGIELAAQMGWCL
ncbi:MAG TPA: hypothetical protein VMS17_29230 [Gemmataceae bacterium]|nr:hypothetical protein [Gemmataceae bacterium]